MQQMECLKVEKGRDDDQENNKQTKASNVRDSDGDYDANEDAETDSAGSESSHSEDEDDTKRVSKVKGIDFVKERDNLSKLTVVKLKYYTERNGINVGKVRKAELVEIVRKDIDRHFRC